MSFDINAIRAQFPILSRTIHDKPLAYLDNAASAQKPLAVIDSMRNCFEHSYANVHRGLHTMANETTEAFEGARQKIANFIGAAESSEIIFTKGATEALNLVAYGLMGEIKEGDEIIISQMEHHSNIVPWNFLRERFGAVIKWIPVLEDGTLDMGVYKTLFTKHTKIVSIVHMSNVTGTVNPVKEIGKIAHEHGCVFIVDGTQAAVHIEVDMMDIDADFYAMTGHKLYGPTGIGALYGKREHLEKLRPFQGGGEMIEDVFEDHVTYQDIPHKFEAGTPPIMEAIGFGVAIDWINQFNRQDVIDHEMKLYHHALNGLQEMNSFRLIGNAPNKGAVLSFALEGAHAHDIAQILDRYGIAIRAGQHCTQPLMHVFGVHSTARASFGIYNTIEEVDRLIEGVKKARKFLS
ncbi:MAG: cysteine desulfurase [Robiginitomaculum sp.]|nr:MAG: cysteine desulfurase [Robiginitomaculum sp.]